VGLAAVTDAEGRTLSYGYDALSRQTGVYNLAIQAAPLVRQTYTSDSKVATLVDANNNSTSFTYDGFDRLITTTYPGGTTETATYDAADNVLTRKPRANGGTFTFTYDTLNRPATKTPPTGPVVTYTYDLASRAVGVGDNSSAITSIAAPGSTVTYGVNYTYDAVNRLLDAKWDAPSATAPAAGTYVTFSHTYNTVNQRAGQTMDDSTWLGYPPMTPGTTSYTPNALNQYSAVTGMTPTYDANGNLTGDGTFTFGYDSDNRLVSASGSGNSATYTFDAQSRRKSRTVNGTTTISVTDTDNREVLEYDGTSGQMQRWYAYDLGANGVLNQMNVALTSRATYFPDILGSVVATLDSGTGAPTKFGYLPYGRSGSPSPVQFGFTGQRIDAETNGLY
jgi:YD repeat-containing protein